MNLLGFLPAPFVYGILNDSNHSHPRLAFWITLNYSFIGCMLILIAAIMRFNTFNEREIGAEKGLAVNFAIAKSSDSKLDKSEKVIYI